MRELHGYHGEHARHARDPHAPADNPATRAHDHPKHAARDSLKPRMLLDPEARKAARLDYQRKVEAAEAEYAARHARPGPGDQPRPPHQRRPQQPKPEHAPPESRDQPAAKIAGREKPPGRQREEGRTPERPRLPKTDTVDMLARNGLAVASVAVAFNLLPDSWEKVAASAAAAVIGNVAWANRRWKERHGNRPED